MHIKSFIFFILFLTISACGSGGGTSSSSVTPEETNVSSKYSGIKTAAKFNDSNYLEFIKLLFGAETSLTDSLASKALNTNAEESQNEMTAYLQIQNSLIKSFGTKT